MDEQGCRPTVNEVRVNLWPHDYPNQTFDLIVSQEGQRVIAGLGVKGLFKPGLVERVVI